MKLLAALANREVDDLPAQPSDDDLLAWSEELKRRPRRRQLVADPLG